MFTFPAIRGSQAVGRVCAFPSTHFHCPLIITKQINLCCSLHETPYDVGLTCKMDIRLFEGKALFKQGWAMGNVGVFFLSNLLLRFITVIITWSRNVYMCNRASALCTETEEGLRHAEDRETPHQSLQCWIVAEM